MPNFYIFCINPNASQVNRYNIEELAAKTLSKNSYRIIHSHSISEQHQKLDSIVSQYASGNQMVLVACGGDGTALGVIQFILKQPQCKLSILPIGTGNLLAKSLAIPESPVVYFDRLKHGTFENTISLAQANNQVFSLAASAGLDVKIMENTSKENKQAFGIYAYLVEGLHTLFESKDFDFEITIDGKTINTQAKSIIVFHAHQFLRGLFPFLDFTVDQSIFKPNVLDIIFLNPITAVDHVTLFYSILTAEYLNQTTVTQPIQHFRGKNISIKTKEKLAVQIDGDVREHTPVEINMMNQLIPVLIPKHPENPIKELLPTSDILQSLESFKNVIKDLHYFHIQ